MRCSATSEHVLLETDVSSRIHGQFKLNKILIVLSKQTVFSETHSCWTFSLSVFWVVLVSAVVGIKEHGTFREHFCGLMNFMTVFHFCGMGITVLEKASCMRFNRAFVFIFQCFCHSNNDQHRSIQLLYCCLSKAMLYCKVFYDFQRGKPLNGLHKGVVYSEIYRGTVELP